MAQIIHAVPPGYKGLVTKVITLNEVGRSGITVRYTDISSAVLMLAYVFTRCRNGFKLLTHEESCAYTLERARAHIGEGI